MKPTDYLALAIATCGVGYLPLMPGTYGSLVGLESFLGLTQLAKGNALIAVVLISIVALHSRDMGRFADGRIIGSKRSGQGGCR
jgi:hypothetical protein